jgi:hypothetical protein
MEELEQNSVEGESVRVIAVEDLQQSQQLSFKAMLELFYQQTHSFSVESERS